jgi:hypothetical protein
VLAKLALSVELVSLFIPGAGDIETQCLVLCKFSLRIVLLRMANVESLSVLLRSSFHLLFSEYLCHSHLLLVMSTVNDLFDSLFIPLYCWESFASNPLRVQSAENISVVACLGVM